MRRSTGPTPKTVAIVIGRDHGSCVVCGRSIQGGERGTAWSLQHRQARGMGGSKDPAINAPSNLITVCGSGTTQCHGRIESERTDSERRGWIVRRPASPAETPVLVFSRWVLLTADGGTTPIHESFEEAA